MSEPTAIPASSPEPARRPNISFTLPAPRKRRWVKFLIFGVIAFLFFLMMLNMMAAVVGAIARPGGEKITEEVIRPGATGTKDKIVIIPVEGTIGDEMVERMRKFCNHVKDDPDVKAVILEINSPGGGITASDEIHHLFSDLRNVSKKKLVVSMRTVAASGGYYVAVTAEKIYAERTTLTGSIGVIWPAFEVTGMMEKIGVTPEVIKSDQAKDFKDAGSPLRKFSEDDRNYIRGLVNAAHERFRTVVKEGRDGKLHRTLDQIAIGKIWTADEALEMGLIDAIKYPDEIITQVASEISAADPKVIRLKPKSGFFEALTASSALGGSTKVELKLDPQALQDAAAGKLEYRYNGPTP